MTQDTYGTTVVLVPSVSEALVTKSTGGPHITLMYFGDTPLSDILLGQLEAIVTNLTAEYKEAILAVPGPLDFFKNGDAAVVTFPREDNAGIYAMRTQLVANLTPELYDIWQANEKYPDYKAHMTLGYISEGYSALTEIVGRISIPKAAIWNGDIRLPYSLENESLEHSTAFDRLIDGLVDDELAHEGVLHKSGRYPWGSGENAYQRHKGFLQFVADLESKGLSESEIAKGFIGPRATSSDVRALKSIAKTYNRDADITTALKLKDKKMSNIAIGEQMGINESSVRSLLNPTLRERNDILVSTANRLKEEMGDGYLDIGKGVENHMGIAESKKKVAIAMLEEEGHKVFYVPVQQLGTGKNTNTMVLAPPGTKFPDVMNNKDKIKVIGGYSEDAGRTFKNVEPPVHVDAKRVGVRYKEEGGAEKDGVIELRRGVDDISLGDARYAQVRIGVNGTHYLKGMAMYSDNLPDGVDMMFNTNKGKGDNKLDAMKPIKKVKTVDKDGKTVDTDETDPVLPFGSIVRQKTYVDKNGKTKQSPINIVGGKDGSGEEGGWAEWSKNLSSQMLSKQSPILAKQQLGLTYDSKKSEFDDILKLANPTVKKKLLEEYADGADSSAKHLKAAGLPRTANHVILPINSLKDTEIYAPNYNNGERVVLIRHPHGGIFEIPELTVNNNNREAQKVIKNAKDAVGINSKVAGRLSGADFDGDTVLVIPNNKGQIKTSPALAGLKDFDSKEYQLPKDRPNGLSPKGKQKQMGDISNLITDMTIKGANQNEIARAVRHSMVVIDAEKHNLDYKKSFKDHNITELKTKYQGGPTAGAATLISRAKSTEYVLERKPRSMANGGPIDKATGEKMWEYTGAEYPKITVSKRTGETKETIIKKTTKSTQMDEAKDAFSLSSGEKREVPYAEYANRMKALANAARKEADATKPRLYSPSAKATYKREVDSLNAKLNIAQKNAPLERQAQLLAGTMVTARKQANPGMDNDELKKVRSRALIEARARVGAGKTVISFSQSEWDAVQSGAITTNKLSAILNNADMDQVRQLAMPHERTVMSDAKIRRAQSMLANGYTQAEIAENLGVPASTLNDAIS